MKSALQQKFLQRSRRLLQYPDLRIWICLLLVISTLAVYGQIKNHGFVNFDDDRYITDNPYVSTGLSTQNIKWAFTAVYQATWQPMVWISYMLDCQLHGMDPGRHHLTNLFLHIANALLLFLVLRKMAGVLWQSAFVASLFALHPIHVESVAWLAERKDVLSAFFWMLTIWSYVRYVARPCAKRYIQALLFFVLGLMTKPMLVTLPFIMLLLDYWPLGRIQFGQAAGQTNSPKRSLGLRLVREKLPFFVLAAASCAATLIIQQKGGSVATLDAVPLEIRIANAVVSYVSYLAKMIWPSKLTVFYPHPGTLPGLQVAAAALLLISISLLAIKVIRRHPYIMVGWFWYLGSLVPVIGLVQIGSHAMADRFAYVPLIGIYIITAWGIPRLVHKRRYARTGLTVGVAVLLAALMVTTRQQVRYWADSITLFEHALNVTDSNFLAHNNLGNVLAEQGRTAEAVRHFSEALRIKPGYAQAHYNLGVVLAKQGRTAEAVHHYSEVLQQDHANAEAHFNLGNALLKLDNVAQAIKHYAEALRINPGYLKVRTNLGAALMRAGRLDEALVHFQEVVGKRPGYAKAHNNLGTALLNKGVVDEAIACFKEALRIKPDYPKARINLKNALQARK